MINWNDIISYSAGGAMLMMMMLGIVISALIPALDRWSRRYFITLFSMLLLSIAVLFTDAVIFRLPDVLTAERILVFFEYVTISVIIPMPMILLLHWCKEDIRSNLMFRSIIALWFLFILILIAAQFTDYFYYIKYDTENKFIRGQWFIILPLPMLLMMFINIIGVIVNRKKISKIYFIALLTYLLPMTIALVFYSFDFFATFILFGMALCAMMLFVLILSDSMKQHMLQQQEIAQQKAGIMVLQMRPHFIRNTMMSIYYLCKQDPEKAQQVTLDFATYLHRNFAAIASEDLVSFSAELDHTRAYLAVEQAQHEDNLLVSFDTPHTMFRLPPLTLQPLVENAVKHGMNPDGDPLSIFVKTRLNKNDSEIIVEDNGPGYNPVSDNEPHIALNNIRQRLEMMCNGKLEIIAREGGGTSVKVTIPMSNI